MKIRTKLIFLFLLISLVPILIISFFSYTTAKESITKQVMNELDFIASIQKSRIVSVVEQNNERFGSVVRRTTLQQALLQDTSGGDEEEAVVQNDVDALLKDAQQSNVSFKDIHILNTTGRVVASTSIQTIDEDFAQEEFFQKGQTSEFATDFFIDDDGELRIYLAGPVIAQDDVLGVVVVIESEIDNLLSQVRDYSGLGKTGEILLAKRNEQGHALFVMPSRFHANAALKEIVAKQNVSDPMTQALRKREDIFTNSIDYRGKRVLAATRYIPETDWGLVVKIDEDEAFATLNTITNYFFYTAALTVLLAILNAIFFAETLTKPITKLTVAAKRMSMGDLSQRIQVTTQDEIGELSRSFNSMAEKLHMYYTKLEEKVEEKTQELKQKYVESQRQMAKDEALLASIGEGVIAFDDSGVIIRINTTAEQMTGWQQTEVLGKQMKEIIKFADKHGNVLTETSYPLHDVFKIEDVLRTSITDQLSFVRKNKTTFPVEFTVTKVRMQNVTIGMILVFRDVTRAIQIDRMKTEFISLASHELRTPLSAVKWFAGILLDGDAGELNHDQVELLENISQANERMIHLTNSLLNITRIESGRIIIDPKPVHLGSLLNGVIGELKEKIEHKQMSIQVHVEDNLPILQVDPKIIKEVYANLLVNAIKYTPDQGAIIVKIYPKDNAVITDIVDNGYGIPKNEQSRLFEKFFRATNITSKDTDGSGLGLYMVKALVEASGGTIWFVSTQDVGSTFTISLPRTGSKPKSGEVYLTSGLLKNE